MLYVNAPGEALVKSFEVDITGVGKGVLVAFFPFYHPFHDGLGGVIAAKAGAVHVRLAADAEIEQLQEQDDDQRLTGYEQNLFHPRRKCRTLKRLFLLIAH